MRLRQVINVLYSALVSELSDAGMLEDFCAVTIYPGEGVPADYGAENCGGTAYVRLVQAMPTTDFPQPLAQPGNCAQSLAAQVEIGILRPAPIVDEMNGQIILPDAEEQESAANQQFDDLELIRRAIVEAQSDIRAVDQVLNDMVLGQYTPVGPEGGTYGGAWMLTIEAD